MKQSTSSIFALALLGGCASAQRPAETTPPPPPGPPIVYWSLQVGSAGTSERIADDFAGPGAINEHWSCRLEEVEREFSRDPVSYSEYRGIVCSSGDAHVRARAGCVLAYWRGMVWQSTADLQLARADIGVEQRWETAARRSERAEELPKEDPAIPPRVLLQCRLDTVRSDAAWTKQP